MDIRIELEQGKQARDDAEDRLTELQIERNECEKQIAEKEDVIRSSRGPSRNPLTVAAEALLRGEEYRGILRNHLKCLMALSQSIEEHSRFYDAIRMAGLTWTTAFRNAHALNATGTLDDKNSRLFMYIRDLLRDEWFNREEIETLKAEVERETSKAKA